MRICEGKIDEICELAGENGDLIESYKVAVRENQVSAQQINDMQGIIFSLAQKSKFTEIAECFAYVLDGNVELYSNYNEFWMVNLKEEIFVIDIAIASVFFLILRKATFHRVEFTPEASELSRRPTSMADVFDIFLNGRSFPDDYSRRRAEIILGVIQEYINTKGTLPTVQEDTWNRVMGGDSVIQQVDEETLKCITKKYLEEAAKNSLTTGIRR